MVAQNDMLTISGQAGGDGQVIDLAQAAWCEVPPFAARILADKAKFDAWVNAMGGFASKRFTELYCEAVEFAGPAGITSYLDMARSIDEEHAAGAGKWLAEAVELANARTAREATRRTEAAAAATLKRVTEIKLAADRLASDPRLADGPDFSTRAPMGRAEVDLELRAAMSLATRAPGAYREMLPPVGDLAVMIGVKS